MSCLIEKKSKIPVIILYSLISYGIWSVWEFWGKSAVSNAVENELLSQFVKSGIIKVLVWVLPAVCLVRYFKDDVYIRLKRMFTNKVNILKYIPVYLVFTVYLIGGRLITQGNIAVSENFRYSDLIMVLFVGITEEMVFRGWLLNVTISEKRKWFPIIINAIMFMLIHFPIWIVSGKFISSFVNLDFMIVPILSIIFSWTFIKSKNIWIPITLHMYWDLLTFLFF